MITFNIILLIFCHVLSAFFSGMETGIISMSRLRILHLSRLGDKNATLLLGYKDSPDKLFGTILVGNNIVNVIISTAAASIAFQLWGNIGIAASSFITTATLLLFGEFLPKAWFNSRPLSRCLPLAKVLRIIELILIPISRLMVFITSILIPGTRSKGEGAKTISREELRWLAKNSEAHGRISPLESLMISRALALQTKTAADIMTPISQVISLSPESSLAYVLHLTTTTSHNKFPIIEKETSTCKGIFYVQDVLARITGNPEDNVMEFAREPFFVMAESRADDLLPHLRKNGQRLALVRDKQGTILGIITIDAILAQIVGNLPKDTTSDRAADKDAPVVFNAAGKEV